MTEDQIKEKFLEVKKEYRAAKEEGIALIFEKIHEMFELAEFFDVKIGTRDVKEDDHCEIQEYDILRDYCGIDICF